MMKIHWPPANTTDSNKMISRLDIYYMVYLSSISYAVILSNGIMGRLELYFLIALTYITRHMQ